MFYFKINFQCQEPQQAVIQWLIWLTADMADIILSLTDITNDKVISEDDGHLR